jgi:hypothetical protein
VLRRDDVRRRSLQQRIERRYATVAQQVTIRGLPIHFTRIADPDEMTRHMPDPATPNAAPLWQPYWPFSCRLLPFISDFSCSFSACSGGLAACIPVLRYVLWCNHRRGRGVGMARWILRYGTSRRGYFRGESPLEPPPWGRLLRRTRENAVILARTVSAPLGWRRKKSPKEIPPVGSAGWPYRNSLFEYQLQLAGPMRF